MTTNSNRANSNGTNPSEISRMLNKNYDFLYSPVKIFYFIFFFVLSLFPLAFRKLTRFPSRTGNRTKNEQLGRLVFKPMNFLSFLVQNACAHRPKLYMSSCITVWDYFLRHTK